jgi:hypothetical protein
MFKISGRDFLAVSPDRAVSEAGWKFESEALVEARNIALEEPGLLRQVEFW